MTTVYEVFRIIYPDDYGYTVVNGGLSFSAWYWDGGEVKYVETYGCMVAWFPNIDAAMNAAREAWEYTND